MFIRYKCIYYFIACLLLVIGVYHHIYLLFILGFYLFYLIYKLGFEHTIWITLFVIFFYLFSIPKMVDSNGEIKGQIININDYGYILKVGSSKLLLYGDTKELKQGDIIEVIYEIIPFSAIRNKGEFNQKNYRYASRIYQQGNQISYSKKGFKITLRDRIEKIIDEAGNSKIIEYSKLLILGIRESEMEDLYAQLISLSVVHLFAISGMHFSLLKKILEQFLGIFIDEHKRSWVIIFILTVYILGLPNNVSAFRAYMMVLLTKLNKDYFNKLDLFSAIGIGMLMINPYYIYNLSFIYSFTLYFFVLVLKNDKWKGLWLYLISLPLICFFNYEISLLGFLVAYVIYPLIEWLYLGFLINLLFGFSLNFLLNPLIIIFEQLLSFFIRNPFIIILGKPSILIILIYYVLLIFHLMYKESNKKSYFLIGLIALSLIFYFKPYYQKNGEITMIDVGQGDCIFIRLPYNQGNFLIDTGGLEYKDTATSYIIPYLKQLGIRSIDILFLSHQDFDHVGGKDSLIANFKVDKIVENHDFEFKNSFLTINSLNKAIYNNENDNSLVLSFQFNDFNALFTGDISVEVEKDLLINYPDLKTNILKVAHHGSKTSSSVLFISELEPEIALIPVGKNNFYGHPNQLVIDRLEAYGVSIYRTDLHGMVTIYFNSKGIVINQMLE